MKRLIALTCIGLISALSVAIKVKSATAPVRAATLSPAGNSPGKLVVHEWGTFTGFAGSDGVHLPFNTLIGSDLPGFVMNRQSFAARLDPKLQQALLFIKADGWPALVRMETPVVYFYADKPRDVDVRVDFPRGLLTEFYPPARDMGPKYGRGPGEVDISPQTRPATDPLASASYLDWGRVHIDPNPTTDDSKRVPTVVDKNHYAFARETDSALVQLAGADGSKSAEKFLFYRGLGNFSLPITLVAKGADRFELTNFGTSPISVAFLLDREAGEHTSMRFARFEDLAGNQALTLPPVGAVQGDLSDAIVKSLVAAGLYEKEAQAMVNTWKGSWLDEPGTRLLYILPRPATDAMLPLTVTPMPNETARVFVGRIDILTPERESRLRSLMIATTETSTLAPDDVRVLQSLGRFLWPALQRASRLAGDADQKQASRLYAAYGRASANQK